MSFLSSLFGGSKSTPESRFNTLRDDGIRAMQMNEVLYAAKCFTAALEIKPDLKTEGLLAEAYLRMRNYTEAAPLLGKLVESNPGDVELRLLLVQSLNELRQFDEMKSRLAPLLSADPVDPRTLFLMAEAEHGLDEDFMAIAHLTQTLELRPDYNTARMLRARVLKSMGQYAEVLADAKLLVQADAENEEFLLILAEALYATGNLSAAEETLQALLALNPFCSDAVLHLGAILCETSRWDKALELYDEAIGLRPDFAEAYKARGGVKHHLKDEAGAAEDLKRALELAPEDTGLPDGEYSNVENRMNARYKAMNPYGF